jgi:anti-sigma factor RsiW
MTGNEHISGEDLALHALQALSEREAAAVSAHLALCALCRTELAELSAGTAMINFSVEQHPVPAGARQRFLHRISDASTTETIRKQETSKQVLLFRRTAWIPWGAAAALALIAISLGVANHELVRELRDASAQIADLTRQSMQARRVFDVLTSHSAQRVLLTASKISVEPTGRAIYLADSGSLVFQANDLKQLASDKTYELWVIPVNGKPIPAGLFRPDAAGSASVLLPPLPKGVAAKAFGVTVEKAEGSDTPTAPILLSGATVSASGE